MTRWSSNLISEQQYLAYPWLGTAGLEYSIKFQFGTIILRLLQNAIFFIHSKNSKQAVFFVSQKLAKINGKNWAHFSLKMVPFSGG